MALTAQFSAGEDLTAAKLNASSIPVVSATSDITSPFTGQIIFRTTDNRLYRYTGSAWVVYQQAILDLFATAATQNSVATSESTTSTSYTDLATAGPAVTLTSVGTKALVMVSAGAFTNSAVDIGHAMSFAVSGATTIAASDAYARTDTCTNAGFGMNVMNFAFITITPGSNTYTAKYKLSGATSSTFNNRTILVIAP